MPYRYLEDGSTYDAGFEANAETPAKLFRACWSAALGVMVDDAESIRPTESREIELDGQELELLLFDLLGELIYLKDAEHALYRMDEARVDMWQTDPSDRGSSAYRLRATISGESIDPRRHSLGVDVKAVTLDQLRVWEEEGEHRARVILDT